jgi:hypothetical protein
MKNLHKMSRKELKDAYSKSNCYDKIYINELLYNIYNQLGGTISCNIKEDYNIDDTNERTTFLHTLLKDNIAIANTLTDKYTIVGQKKSKYYVHTYVPSPLLTEDESFNGKDIFDLTTYENCCNCIVYSIYSNIDYETFGKENLSNPLKEYSFIGSYKNILSYIICIKTSIENVLKNLENWIVRIYFNTSIFELINFALNNECIELYEICNTIINYLEYIFSIDIVEIYIVSCNDKCNSDSFGLTRSMRFLPLCDNDVNILICKDADGIITNQDCKYIKSFETSAHIFYIQDIWSNDEFVNTKFSEYKHYNNVKVNLNIEFAYSSWLKYYVIYEKEFYDNNFGAFATLLAGCSGYKLKIKEDMFNIKKEEIFVILKELNKLPSGEPDKLLNLNFAFDELFLRHLFRDYLSVKTKLSEEEYYLQRNKIFNSIKYIKPNKLIDMSKINLSILIDLYNEKSNETGIEPIKAPTLNVLDSDTDEEKYYKTNIINKLYNDNSFIKTCNIEIMTYNFNAIVSLILCDLLNYNQIEDKIYDYKYIIYKNNTCKLDMNMYLSYFINLNNNNSIYISIINYIYWYFQKDIMKLISFN